MVTPKQRANLIPAKKGEVRNPLGINRKRPITDEYFGTSQDALPEALRKKINESMGEEILPPGATWAKANALRRFLDALQQGGHPSSREIREAIEGKAPQRLEITGPQSQEITIRIVHDRQKPQ